MNLRGYAPAVVLLGLLLFGSPTINPDAMEMVDVGRCLLGFNDADVGCEQLDLWAYPPFCPVIVALLSVIWGPWSAAALIGAIGAALLVVPMGFLAERLVGRRGFGFAVALLVFLPILRFYGTTADPRLACIAMVMGAWCLLLMDESRHPRTLFFVGVLGGVSVLTRPEGIVHAGLILGVTVLVKRRAALWSLLGAGIFMVPYLAWLSTRLGTLVFSPRAWELRGVGLLELLPVRWLIQLWGVGATRPAFRSWLEQSTSSTVVDPGSVVASLLSVGRILATSIPMELHILAGLGLVLVLVQGACRRTVAVLGFLCIPPLVVSFSPMGLDLGMPLKNLLAVVVVEVVLAAAFLGWLTGWLTDHLEPMFEQEARTTTREKRRVRFSVGVGVLLATCIGMWWVPTAYLDNRFWTGTSEETQRASQWLSQNTASTDRVASSFGSGPVARRAGRVRVTIPSPWEMDTWSDEGVRPQWLVVTALDGLWPLRSPDLLQSAKLEPSAFFSTDHGWAMILSVK